MDLFLFVVFLAATGCAGATGTMFRPGAWYEQLDKPDWVPPNSAFPVVWATLYVLSAIAGTRVAGEPGSGPAMAFWALQIAANTLWTPVFFGLRRLRAALPVMGVLWIAVLGALITHWQVDLWAGVIFIPYLAWVTAAGALNIAMVRLNPEVQPLDPSKL